MNSNHLPPHFLIQVARGILGYLWWKSYIYKVLHFTYKLALNLPFTEEQMCSLRNYVHMYISICLYVNLIGSSDQILFSVAPCTSSPCINGGVCSNLEGNVAYSCDCPSTYNGVNCEIQGKIFVSEKGKTHNIEHCPEK